MKTVKEIDIRDLLLKYSQYLHDCGYMDDDWWCEEPNSVDRFLNEVMTEDKI